MAAYEGSIVKSTNWSDRGKVLAFTGKVSWSSALADADTLTIPNFNKDGTPITAVKFTLYGSVGDVHATPTLAIKAGVTGDDDCFLPSTIFNVSAAGRQVIMFGTGDAVNGTTATITGKDLIITLTDDPATTTGVTTGTWYVEVEALGQQGA
jgi:hypothetical protein